MLNQTLLATASGDIEVIKRDGSTVPYDPDKYYKAMMNAFLDTEGLKAKGVSASSADISDRIVEKCQMFTRKVHESICKRPVLDGRILITIEEIQDLIELQLMRAEERLVFRDFIMYREQHAQRREAKATGTLKPVENKCEKTITVVDKNGENVPFSITTLCEQVREAAKGLEVDTDMVISAVTKSLTDGRKLKDIRDLIIMEVRGLIDKDPDYSKLTARMLMLNIANEANAFLEMDSIDVLSEIDYVSLFPKSIAAGVALKRFDEKLMSAFDLDALAKAIVPERDNLFTYLSLQSLYDRYYTHEKGERYEVGQTLWMRVAMGLALSEDDPTARAIEFYNLFSQFDYMSSTPTLFNSGTVRSQMSSCYLSYIPDDLEGIYGGITENAMLQKYAGGIGNDWTAVRALGSYIQGTNGESQGTIPFMKVANDTAVAVNQGGKRKGAVCAYLETWHLDVMDFIELRKNAGDERRRTHDMNTANWIPDLFMKRVAEDGEWTLFSPNDVPDLHDLTGDAFETAYAAYEAKTVSGEITLFKTVKAVELWRKMLGMVFETGHPWITFKDAINVRYTNQHAGMVHSSNLCTEITLHTNREETAVCNLGSINLANHMNADGTINVEKLEGTVKTAVRMLDNVIELNYYNSPKAKKSNLMHRPVGLGMMGFHDALYIKRIPYASEDAIAFADLSMETISYFAIKASTDLAEERGRYESFEGSLWSQGILPIDSLDNLQETRGKYLKVNKDKTLDWDTLRDRVKTIGMRNSNVMAIAPTATISNICGVSQSIEPTYQNLFVKSNLSGEFVVVNPYMVRDLKKLGLWDDVMINDLKYYDGSVDQITRIPEDIRALYATAFEIDAGFLVECASRRQKWIDQAQSLNLYMAQPSGKKLDSIYKLAWVRGLKTTYYLRTMGATGVDKNVDKSDDAESAKPATGKPAAASTNLISGFKKPELVDACGPHGGCS